MSYGIRPEWKEELITWDSKVATIILIDLVMLGFKRSVEDSCGLQSSFITAAWLANELFYILHIYLPHQFHLCGQNIS